MTQTNTPASKRKAQVWIFTPEAKCLILRTNEDRGNFWQPVTGSIENNEVGDEGFAAGALREAKEETSLEFTPATLKPTGYEFTYESRNGTVLERVFAILTPKLKAPRLDPSEHDDYSWSTPEQAISKIKYPSNKEGLKAALKVMFGKTLAAIGWAMCATGTGLLWSPDYALSAQDGRVRLDGTAIHSQPTNSANVLETKNAGDIVRMSSKTMDGWFKARTSQGQIGWIKQEDVTLEAFKTTYDYANLDRGERQERAGRPREIPLITLRLGYGPQQINHLVLSDKMRAGSGNYHFSTLFTGELEWHTSKTFSLALRLERIHSSGSLNNYSIELNSLPIHIGARLLVLGHKRRSYVGVGAYGGLDFMHDVTVAAPSNPDPNSAVLSPAFAYSGVATIDGRAYIAKWFSLYAELGVRYMQARKINFDRSFYPIGNDFRAGDNLEAIAVNHLGAYLVFGPAFNF